MQTHRLRIKSLYEDTKSYNAQGCLPPPNISYEQFEEIRAFTVPSTGDQIEISTPADNGAAALDKVTITLTDLPF